MGRAVEDARTATAAGRLAAWHFLCTGGLMLLTALLPVAPFDKRPTILMASAALASDARRVGAALDPG